jgi:hypothetical protein
VLLIHGDEAGGIVVSNQFGLIIAQDLRTGQPIAKRLELIELPDNLLVAVISKICGSYHPHGNCNDEITVVEFGERRPMSVIFVSGVSLISHDLAIRRHLTTLALRRKQ